jgi:spore coat protein A
MLLRIVVGGGALAAVVCALVGCGDSPATGQDAAIPDLTMVNVPEDGGDDLASTDGGTVDGGDGGADTHQALRLPADAVPLKQDGGVDYYEIHIKPGMEQVVPGAMTPILGFDGHWPGPTVHATLGRPTTLRIFNDLPVAENISIHNHGHNVIHAYDGHPSDNVVAKGAFYDYKYPNMQEGGTAPNLHGAGTYFFHDHVQALTAQHVYSGMSAFYLIHPAAGSAEAALNLPSGAYDIPLLIQDRSFNADNTLRYDATVIKGFQGEVMVVNGTAQPFLKVARRKYRFRVLNAANARFIRIGLSTGSMYQIGSDGGLLPTRLNPSKIALGPAERADIVIDFAQYKIGDVITMTNDDPFMPAIPEVMQFRIDRDEADTSTLPTDLNPTFVRYTAATPAVTRTRDVVFSYDSGAAEWKLNGKTYDSSATEFNDSKLGDVEIWNLKNTDTAFLVPHPFHQHLIEFQILDICPMATPNCGVAPVGSQAGWKDTVSVPPTSIVRIKMQWYYNGAATDPYAAGSYVFHCHNLEHEDHSMMLQQLVSP